MTLCHNKHSDWIFGRSYPVSLHWALLCHNNISHMWHFYKNDKLNLHKCAGDSIISQYNKVTERTAAGWNEIIYLWNHLFWHNYRKIIHAFHRWFLCQFRNDWAWLFDISSNWVTAVAKVSYFDDLIEKHSSMFKSPQSLSLTTLISLDSELTCFYRPASCQFKWGNNLNLDCKRWKVCWNPTWIMEWWKKQYENLQTPKCCIRKYTWARSHWNSDCAFWSTYIFTSF